MTRKLPFLILLSLSAACSTLSREKHQEEPAVFAESVSATRALPPPPQPEADRSVAREARLELELSDVEGGARQLRSLAESLDGYVTQANGYTRNDQLFYYLTVRIPATRLAEFLASSRSLALRVISEQETAEDVTEQILDVDVRIRNLTAAEVELRRLLAESRERKSKVSDIMEILAQLTETRTRIEQLEAQQKNLSLRVEMATVSVTLSPEPIHGPLVEQRWRPWEVLAGASRTLVLALQKIFEVSIYLIVVVLPILALGLLCVWVLVTRLLPVVYRRS